MIVRDKKAEDVVIRVEPSQANTYHLAPTYDFKQELLSHGAFVEVLSPDWFRDEIRCNIADMASHYGLATTDLTGDKATVSE